MSITARKGAQVVMSARGAEVDRGWVRGTLHPRCLTLRQVLDPGVAGDVVCG
jgi:hypothetical protein